ncbi:MAG: adenosylcobinamide-GDP ribazoletransferase, partial [Desulfatitalea sp.]|nr:adenosylcobinamide-GDP ribazoletransferase [Desulfatitalea sp.]NNK02547.1 adenosylcobinamide-GDP ribazoletransferase [Desulfatitalea sp.]
HLDGLADTADGLYGHRPIERALAIMKDSRVGAMGLVTVVCCLALKWAGFSAIEQHRFWHLLLVPGFSRATVLFGTQYLPYGRPEGGTGQAFFEQRPRWRDYSGLCALWITALLLTGWDAIWLAAGMSLITVATLSFYKKKVNCITGDMLGAMIEITETGLFLLLAAVAGASAGATV